MEEILVSVYCLAYNHGKYIRKALDGFVSQKATFKYEVFVHDDASTDNTAEIIREYAEKYPEIIKPIFQTENQYSKGIKICQTYIFPKMKGKYIAVCEGDDYWCDNLKLQKQVDFLEAHSEYSACVHNSMIFNANTNKYMGYVSKRKKNSDLFLKDVIYGGGSAYQTSSLLMKREYCFNKPAYFQVAKGYGDYPLSVYLTTDSKIRYLSDTMSVYRWCSNPTSWTKKIDSDKNKLIEHIENVCTFLGKVKEYVSEEQIVEVDKAIIRQKIGLEALKGNYDIIKSEPYKSVYRQQSFSFRLKFFIKKNFPWLYSFLKKKLRNG